MSVLQQTLADMTARKEEKEGEKARKSRWGMRFHIMPPTGWLNDPNGLCWYEGKYRFFFQYSPFSPTGGLKLWGAYSSEDLVHWTYEGAVLFPDSPWDCHGAYSGSALTDDGKLELFYTGNIKLDGDYDYIHNGREAYVLYTASLDGIHFGEKQCLLGRGDYPEDYTCHVRDPKVWKEGQKYYMVLGGRKKCGKGAALFYESSDKEEWKFSGEIAAAEDMGDMWECPDVFSLGGERILSVSPQRVEREEFRFQNIYQSGYFLIREGGKYNKENFVSWDYGFDFYAPQTFCDNRGRRILTAWAGLPDIEGEYTNPTVGEGWQHVFTTPRELTYREGKVYQYPVEEVERLRKGETAIEQGEGETEACFDLEISGMDSREWEIRIEETCCFRYDGEVLSLCFTGALGAGRTVRRVRADRKITSLRLLGDTSLLELYVNEGEWVFTTRYYPLSDKRRLKMKGITGEIRLYPIENR